MNEKISLRQQTHKVVRRFITEEKSIDCQIGKSTVPRVESEKQVRSEFQVISKSLYERLSDLPVEVIFKIFLKCDLKTILSLRLVSTLFNKVATIHEKQASPLEEKAAIVFDYDEFRSGIVGKIRQKLAFANEVRLSEVYITTDFVNFNIDILEMPSLFPSVLKNKLRLILKINTLDEVAQLQERFPEQENQQTSFELEQIGLNRIQGLDLGGIAISRGSNGSINRLLNSVSKTINLKTLVIGEMAMNTFLEQQDSLNSLISLTIKKIRNKVIINILNSLNKLTSLTIERFCSSSPLVIPDTMTNLTALYVKVIESTAVLSLQYSLDKLKIIHIGRIQSYSAFKLESPFDNLETLTIEAIGIDAHLDLPSSLKNLQTLTIPYISLESTIKLPISCNNLMNFTFEGAEEDDVFKQLIEFREQINLRNQQNQGFKQIIGSSILEAIV